MAIQESFTDGRYGLSSPIGEVLMSISEQVALIITLKPTIVLPIT